MSQRFSYGGNDSNSASSLPKSKNAFPLPIPTIPEESYKEKHLYDDPPKKSSHTKNLVRSSTIVSSSLNDKSFGGSFQ